MSASVADPPVPKTGPPVGEPTGDGVPTARDGRRRSSWRKKLLAICLSLLASFLAGELLVRVLVGGPLAERLPIMEFRANPHRGWEMVPGQDHYTYHHPVRINSHGLRGPEIGPKSGGTVRVLALGDSLVYGQGVAEEDTIPALLQAGLATADPEARGWEVINAGHRAYATHQELGLLEELGPELQPDVVLVCWYWNDVQERDIQATYERWKGHEPVAFDTGDRIEGGSWWKWQGVQLARRSALVMFLHDAKRRLEAHPVAMENIEEGVERLGSYLARFQALSRKMGFRLVFAIIPDASALAGPHESIEAARLATETARARGIEPIDLTPAMRRVLEEDGRLPIIPFDGHYLPRGNRAMAEALVEHLLE